MDLKQIERLMTAMGRNGMKKLVLKQEGFEIELEKESAPGASYAPSPVYIEERPRVPLPAVEEKKQPEPVKDGKFITSPMVGTFYSAPSPDDPSFVKVGDSVEATSVVCIIEAMKVMNEVKAGVAGVVAEILLKNGDPVEFGTKIFRIT